MNELVELEINRSMFDRENWKSALNGITELCASFHTHIVLFDKNAQLVDAFVSTLPQLQIAENSTNGGGIQEYLKYKDQDIRIPKALANLGIGDSLNHHDLFENNELKHSNIYKEYLSKHNAEEQALSRLYGPKDSIVLMALIRGNTQGRYQETELLKIRQLMPLIQNTLHTQFELEHYKLYQQSLTSLLEQQKIGIIYLDRNMEIVETSPLAQSFLNKKDGLIDRFRKIGAINKADDSRLQKFLCLDYRQPHYNSLFIQRSNHEAPYKLTISPILGGGADLGEKEPKLMLLVSEPGSTQNFPVQLFKDHYQLTNAELALANAIFNDQSLINYAESKGIKISTVRWTLENISSKTGTHGQKELKSLALTFA